RAAGPRSRAPACRRWRHLLRPGGRGGGEPQRWGERVLRRAWSSLDGGQRRSLGFMTLVVVGLHVAGFALLAVAVSGHHLAVGRSGAFAIGTGLTAYML